MLSIIILIFVVLCFTTARERMKSSREWFARFKFGDTLASFFWGFWREKPWFIPNDKILQKRTLLVSLQRIGENSDTFRFTIVLGEFAGNPSSQFLQCLSKLFETMNETVEWCTLKLSASIRVQSSQSSPSTARWNPMVDLFLAYLPS